MDKMLSAGPAYLAFAVLAIVGPGIAVQRLLLLRIDPALVLPLGTAIAAGGYWLSLALGLPWLFPAMVLVLDLSLLRRGPWRRADGPSLRGAAPPLAALVLLLSVTQYPWNRLASGGEFLLDPLVPYDTAFHVGLARELTLGYPPQLPGVSGFPVGYHLGADLVRAAALHWAGVDPYDSISRFDVTLGALALVLALRGYARRAGLNRIAVAVLPWTLLATDCSFLFSPDPRSNWWADLLRGNILISLALANPVVPALALLLGALVALSRYEAGEGYPWLALAAAQAFAVPYFKVFLGAHLLLGLSAATLLSSPGRRAGPLALALPCALSTALLVLGPAGRTVNVVLAPLDLARITRESLGMPPLSGAALLAWSALWVFASLGLRILGLSGAVRALRGAAPSVATAAAMALSAWPLGLLLRVSAPEVLPGQRFVNDAAYVIEQGGPLLWVFTVPALVTLAAAYRPLLVGALCAALAIPSTIQFVVRKMMEPPDPLPAPIVRAMDSLKRASRPGDVVLQRPGARFPPAPVILIGRRVPYERFTPYLTQFATRDELERRHETVYRFFQTNDATEALGIARGLDARFVCLYGPDRLRFEAPGAFETVHSEPGARCFALRYPGSSAATGLVASLGGIAFPQPRPPDVDASALSQRLRLLCRPIGGTVGVAVAHVETGRTVDVDGRRRLPLYSVFKLPLAVSVLKDVEEGRLRLDQRVRVTPAEVVPGSPDNAALWRAFVERSIRELLELSIVRSDNTSSDKLLQLVGGPAALTRRMRSLGFTDIDIRRSVREFMPARVHPNTASAAELARLLSRLERGEILQPAARETLLGFMAQATTGAHRLRGGLPPGTPVADKTGTGPGRSATNDVGIITLPGGRGHLAMAVLVSGSKRPADAQEKLIADLARAAYDAYLPAPAGGR